MRGWGLAIAALALSPAIAYAEDYVLHVQASPAQQSRFDDGRHAVDDTAPSSKVRVLEPKQQTPRRSGFRILLINVGGTPFNFGPENIRIRLPNGKSVAMLDYDAMMREQRHREKWQAIAAGLGAMGRSMQASSAGYTSGTYSGNSFGSVGTTPFQSSTTGTFSGYDSAAAAAAQQNANTVNQAEFARIQAMEQAQRANIETIMKTTTVDPGATFGGVVQYDVPQTIKAAKAEVPVVIEITTGSDVHAFAATLQRYHK